MDGLDEAARTQIRDFLNGNANPTFNPPHNLIPYVLKADWWLGRYENTKTGRLHWHALIRMKDFDLIDKVYTDEDSYAACQRLMDWVNQQVGSQVRLFGQELKERIQSQNFDESKVFQQWDTSKFSAKMMDKMNTDPRRAFDKPRSHSNYRQYQMIYNVWRSMKANQDILKDLQKAHDARPGENDLFEVEMRRATKKDVKDFTEANQEDVNDFKEANQGNEEQYEEEEEA